MIVTAAWSRWTAELEGRGIAVLPQSHLVPVDLWLRTSAGEVLNLTGRGTTVRLRSYAETDLTGLLLRAECDCRSHREAGATPRLVLRPGTSALAEASYDGAARHGWTGVHAARLGVPELRPLLDLLLTELLAPGPVVRAAV